MSVELVVAGSVNLDVVLRVPRMPAAGETLAAAAAEFHCGGKGANQAVAAALAGASVAMVGAVGGDEFGDRSRTGLVEAGVDPSGLRRLEDSPTGTAWILVEETSGENRILLSSGANAGVRSSDLEPLLVRTGVRRLLLQNEIPCEVVVDLAARARARGVPITFNAAPAPNREFLEALRGCFDTWVVNESEGAQLLGLERWRQDEEADLLSRLQQALETHELMLTRGARGALWWGAERWEVGVLPGVKVVDTTGAGDAFVGVFEAARCAGVSLPEALARASAAGALACTSVGARSAMPTSGAILRAAASIEVAPRAFVDP